MRASAPIARLIALLAIAAAAILAALLWRALRTGDSRGATLIAVAFALFILVRYFDWFWDWIPAWAFFVVLAGMAFASIALLRRVRHRPETEAI